MFLHIYLVIGCLKQTPLAIISTLLFFIQMPIQATATLSTDRMYSHHSTLPPPIPRKLLKIQHQYSCLCLTSSDQRLLPPVF